MVRKMALATTMMVFMSGCMTDACRRAYVRAKKYTAAQADDPLAAAMTDELGVANKVSGADKVPEESVPLSVEASRANTVQLQADYRALTFWKGIGKGVLDLLGSHIPWLAPVIGGAAGILALGKKLMTKTRALKAAISLTSKVKEAVKGEGNALDKLRGVYNAAKQDGPGFVAGSKELYAAYQDAKTKKMV